MRVTPFARQILQALLFVSIPVLAGQALAWENSPRPLDDPDQALPAAARHGPAALPAAYSMSRRASLPKRWLCEYLDAPDGVLYMYCSDVVSLMNDDELDDQAKAGSAMYFPVWSRPKSDAGAIDLAQRLLCQPQAQCQVELASARSGGLRVAFYGGTD